VAAGEYGDCNGRTRGVRSGISAVPQYARTILDNSKTIVVEEK
jgi:hypothetical protein